MSDIKFQTGYHSNCFTFLTDGYEVFGLVIWAVYDCFTVSAEEDCSTLAQETPEGSESGETEETKKGLNYYLGKMKINKLMRINHRSLVKSV